MAASLARGLARGACRLVVPRIRGCERGYALGPNVERSEEKPADVTSSETAHIPQRKDFTMYSGIAEGTFPEKTVSVLLAPVKPEDVEIKPDGLIYLPEIKYRRIMNQAFGPGGWGLVPHGDSMHFHDDIDGAQLVTREYTLHCHGRFVAQATGEHTFYGKSNLNYGKACESAKSNALMRCCKDLGVASELWDPQFIHAWKKKYADEVWCQNLRTKEKKKLWRKKNSTESFAYPWKEVDYKGTFSGDYSSTKSND